jgi:hypothetical protein
MLSFVEYLALLNYPMPKVKGANPIPVPNRTLSTPSRPLIEAHLNPSFCFGGKWRWFWAKGGGWESGFGFGIKQGWVFQVSQNH